MTAFVIINIVFLFYFIAVGIYGWRHNQQNYDQKRVFKVYAEFFGFAKMTRKRERQVKHGRNATILTFLGAVLYFVVLEVFASVM